MNFLAYTIYISYFCEVVLLNCIYFTYENIVRSVMLHSCS